jgi:hypothetical protein
LATVETYWADLNNDAFYDAWTWLAPGISTASAFATGEEDIGFESGTFDGDVIAASGDSATIAITYLETMDQEYGCRTWTGDYDMMYEDGSWVIGRAAIVPTSCE